MLGPGLLESAYEQCMAHELTIQGVDFRLQVPTPVEYKGLRLDCAFRADVVVQDGIIVELKSVDTLTALHEAQLLASNISPARRRRRGRWRTTWACR